jgi:RNA polymerase sigma-70 factor (ECF subfamily)
MHAEPNAQTDRAPESQIRPCARDRDASAREVRDGLAALRPDLYARALRLSRCASQADDIVQETMVRALRFAPQYRAGTNLRAWVGQVLMSVFLTQCRRQKRERRALDNLAHDPCAWIKRDAPSVMRTLSSRSARALEGLPVGYRQAVELVDLQQLSYRDAAERLAVPVGTIMSRLHRGRKLLAEQLGADLGRPPKSSALSNDAPLAA